MRNPIRKEFMSVLVPSALALSAHAQMRVVNWNCARLLGDQNAFQDVIEEMMIDDSAGFATAPWVVVFQEVPSDIDDDLLTRLSAAAPGGVIYAQATYTSSVIEDGSGGAVALYYRADKLTEIPAAHADIPTGANRNTDRWLLTLNNYTSPQVSFYVYGSHLKAENDPPDIAERNAGANAIRNNANTLPAGAKIIYLGDYNLYVNTEPAYITMTNPGNGRAIDAYGNGSWGGGGANAIKLTQSPCLNCDDPDLVGGGLDDRFDFIFFTEALNNSTGLGRIVGTYRAMGNDGGDFNDDVNGTNNFYYPGQLVRSNALADDLHDASDHLPVILDFRLPAIAHAQMPSTIGPVIEGAAVTHPLTVANLVSAVSPAGADPLNYTAIGTGGLSGGGAGSVGPLPDTDILDLVLDTSMPGVIGCGAAVFSTGQDVQNASIVLLAEATVLRHAVASFAPRELIEDAFVSVRFEANSGVQQINVPVYNLGYDELQALLNLNGIGAQTSPIEFSGDLPIDIGEEPGVLTFEFDTDANSSGIYSNTFEINASDEFLPGSTESFISVEIEVTINRIEPPACMGDLVNGDTFAPPPDGTVDAADLAFLLGEWGAAEGSPADFVSSRTFAPPPDGVVDAADLAALLGNWGLCD